MLVTVGDSYTRKSLAVLFQNPNIEKSREGIVSRNGQCLLFVTLDKTKQPNKTLHYNDFFQKDLFHWDSQNSQHADTPAIKNIRNGNVEIFLFARIQAKIKGDTQPFICCGKLQFISLDINTKNPVHIIYQALDYQTDPNQQLKSLYEWEPQVLSTYKLETNQIIKTPRAKSSGQGFGLTGPERKVVDLYAMSVAFNELRTIGATQIANVSMNEPRDYTAEIRNEVWSIEVKGTTSSIGESFFATKNEKVFHEINFGKTGLIFVTDIKLSNIDGKLSASGGKAEVILPWDTSEWEFEPITYKVSKKFGIR
jgi:hypothetical protein